MLLYIDDLILKYENEKKYIECIQYLYELWQKERNSKIYLRLCLETWYVLTFDQIEISLNNEEIQYLSNILKKLYKNFLTENKNDDEYLLVWGYMMYIRPDLFLKINNNYLEIEQTGLTYIEMSEKLGNKLALLLDDKHKNKEKQNVNLDEYFNKKSVVDDYFLEVLSMLKNR